jgi:hypothetical protein
MEQIINELKRLEELAELEGEEIKTTYKLLRNCLVMSVALTDKQDDREIDFYFSFLNYLFDKYTVNEIGKISKIFTGIIRTPNIMNDLENIIKEMEATDDGTANQRVN